MIYYDKQTHNLYFMRDKIGRNTLLFHKSEQSIIISSVLGKKNVNKIYLLKIFQCDYETILTTTTHDIFFLYSLKLCYKAFQHDSFITGHTVYRK